MPEIENKEGTLNAISKYLEHHHENSCLIVNGDLLDDDDQISLSFIKQLANIYEQYPHARLVLNQGDRDWGKSGKDGWNDIQFIEKTVANWHIPNVIWTNSSGCPGPEVITLDPHLQLMVLNTQWSNHPFEKPTPNTISCPDVSLDKVLDDVRKELFLHKDQNVLICGHYPLISNGEYGGRFSLKDWLLPIPLVSTFKTSYKKNVGTSFQITNKYFNEFRQKLIKLLSKYSSLIYCGGHENATEVISTYENYNINVGNRQNHAHIGRCAGLQYCSPDAGISELKYMHDGGVEYNFYTLASLAAEIQAEQLTLFQAPCNDPLPQIPVNERLVPCALQIPVSSVSLYEHPDSTTIAPGPQYKSSFLTKQFFGENYRSAWRQEVKVPHLSLERSHDGLIPYAASSIGESKALFFSGGDGFDYGFKPADKETIKVSSNDVFYRVANILIHDRTTTQYPYAELICDYLQTQVGIDHPRLELVVLPDDPQLGSFRHEYGGELGFLFKMPAQEKLGKSILTTNQLVQRITNRPEIKIDKDQYLLSRIFDIWVGDWNREEENLLWLLKDELFVPFVVKREDAFSSWRGLFPHLADKEWANKSGEHFGKNLSGIKSLNYESLHLDRFLLGDCIRHDFRKAVVKLQSVVTDQIIDGIAEKLPTGYRAEDVTAITKKLKTRKSQLNNYIDKYYELINRQVDVVGTNADDKILVRKASKESLQILTTSRNDQSTGFNKTFYADTTSEINIFGMQGRDSIIIDSDLPKKIKIHIIPGNEGDVIIERPIELSKDNSSKSIVFSKNYYTNKITNSKGIRVANHAPDEAYYYDRNRFEFNRHFPLIYLFYNSDRGLELRTKLSLYRYKYGQEKYWLKHAFKARASSNGNFMFQYTPTWKQLVGNWDLQADVMIVRNELFNYYFGVGLEDRYSDSLLDANYYSLSYNTFSAGISIQKEFWKNGLLKFGFRNTFNSDQRQEHTILENEEGVNGVGENYYGVVHGTLDLDARDSRYFPKNGSRLFLTSKTGSDYKLNEGLWSSAYGFFEQNMTGGPFTFSLRVGGAFNQGNIPFFENFALGRNNFLLGYRQNRFLGDQAMFGNAELRIAIGRQRKKIVPIQWGFNIFTDAGRIYHNNGAQSNRGSVHTDFGLGFYLVPIKDKFLLSIDFARSKEESLLLNFNFGRKF